MLGRKKPAEPQPLAQWATVDGNTVVHVTGDLDFQAQREFIEYFEREVPTDLPVLIDLGAVMFIDSTGLTALLQAIGSFREHGTPTKVINASGQARTLFDQSGLRDLLMGDDTDGALPYW